MTEVPATPSDRQEQGREAFRLFGYYAHNPYAPRINDICAYANWLEGFLQAQWAAEWKLRHEATFSADEAYALFLCLDDLARIRRGKDRTVNFLRERVLPVYRQWHDDNPGMVHPDLSLVQSGMRG